jgi:hypothetical protein
MRDISNVIVITAHFTLCSLYKFASKSDFRDWSKMATMAQKQTVWALRLQNLTETLEPLLEEIKQQGESKLQHPEPLACGKLLHTTSHWENRGAAMPSDVGSKPAWETLGRPPGEHQASRSFSPTTRRINQHSPWADRPLPHKKKKNWTIN